ncbi:uncharacterized protein LOC133530945 [Cydia pomonella]|uniref:uncharacterized protein LOC133530945 n=1 Tax=Cydia pomonella TaxID=82600 RepID=UPI002ADDBF00|nr:uncharacterized protein LOC133530945 [Cydia pomonella]
MTGFVNKEIHTFNNQVREAEIRIAAFVAEHNLPYAITDHLTKLIVKTCPDSKIAESLKCSRPRVQAIVDNVIGEESFKALCEDLRNNKFSLIIDESTDRSTTKHLCLVVRYVKNYQVRDSFLGLIPLVTADAATLYNNIIDFFKVYNIPYEQNLIGFASDGANVMMGSNNSVMTLLTNELKELFVMKCICHSFHLCASYACSKIPRFVENTIRDIYNYFSSSPKRVGMYREFQIFCELKIHKILHPCQTRWLSVHAAVSRVLEQYQALKLFFIDASLNDEVLAATNILQKINDPVTLLFLQFLDFVLPIFNKLNKEMQSEHAKIHVLYDQVCTCLKTLFECFLKRDYVKNTVLEKIEYKNPHMFLNLDDMYFGANAMGTLLKDKNLTSEQTHLFKTRCLQFFIEACDQIIARFPIKNNPIQHFSAFCPENVKKGERPSIVDVVAMFPKLHDSPNYQELDTEWRLLRNTKDISKFSDNIEEFWMSVSTLKCGDNSAMFPKLSAFVFNILVLPHSSANVERVFSSINLMKTCQRNRLCTRSIIGLLHTKQYIDKNNCYNFPIGTELHLKMSQKGWYTIQTNE